MITTPFSNHSNGDRLGRFVAAARIVQPASSVTHGLITWGRPLNPSAHADGTDMIFIDNVDPDLTVEAIA